MEREQYDLMFAQEERHWWYVGMRRISSALLERFPPQVADQAARPLDVLDAGCGSGGMTRYLQRFGRVTGIDLSTDALRLARKRELPRLARASIGALPFLDNSFDVVTSFDVLYHLNVENDGAALADIHRVLRPGGSLHVVDVRGDALSRLFEDAGFDCAVVGSGHIRLAGRLTYLRATRPA